MYKIKYIKYACNIYIYMYPSFQIKDHFIYASYVGA